MDNNQCRRMKTLEREIAKIGNALVKCHLSCDGISCNPRTGKPPRCLILESEAHKSLNGCVIIGLNPGQARKPETSFYKRYGTTYRSVVQYWNKKIAADLYYTRLRELIRALGLSGPILWSELCKCENAPKSRPTLKTLRTCTGRYLSRELDLIPKHWPLFGIGVEAYKALAYRYPHRTTIGVPHPRGAYGKAFLRHLPAGASHSKSARAIKNILKGPTGGLIWMGDIH